MARPTARRRGNSAPMPAGVFADTRESWVTVHTVELVNHIGADDDVFVIEAPGAEVHRLSFRFRGRKQPIWLNLTSMTEAELDALQSFINRAIDLARPSVQAIDEFATRRFEEGDDSYARVYRAVPQFFVRKGKVPQHGQSVPSGPDGAPSDTAASGGLPAAGGVSGELPDSLQDGVGTGDDSPEAGGV